MAQELPERFKTASMRMSGRTSPVSNTTTGVGDTASAVTQPDTDDVPSARPAAAPLRLLRFPTVRERTGLSRSTIWRLERRGEFPRHRRISANAVAWVEDEIMQWIQSRVTSGTG